MENDDGIKANKEIMKKARSGSSTWKSASSDNERLYKKEESLREEKKQLGEEKLEKEKQLSEKEKQLSEKEKQLSEKEKQRTAEKELEVLKMKEDQVKRPKVAFPENLKEAWRRTKELGVGVDIECLLSSVDMNIQKSLLGDLFKEEESLPVLNGRIDMRLYNNENGKRAASILLSEQLSKGLSFFWLIAVSGSGKTSSLFELGSDHYVVYVQCTDTVSRPGSIEDDLNFAWMVSNIQDDLGNSEEDNWGLVERKCKLDILARTFTLYWLWKKLGRIPEPREYLMFQLTTEGASVIRDILEALGSIDSVKLYEVDNFCRLLFHALKSVQDGKRRLVLAVDEIEADSKICRRFRRCRKEFGVNRGIVNVYMSAANSLRLSLNLGM